MRVHICAVGRLRQGPERELIADYLRRFDRTGRQLGLGPATEHQVDDRKGGGVDAEAKLLSRTIPDGAVIVALDERGQVLSSPDFAQRLAGADVTLSFGKMVWPHMLVRVMLAEQLYRAASILSGTPYHRV